MTEFSNRQALGWCLILALGLCLVGNGLALSLNLALLVLESSPDAIYPVGGPISLLAGGLCLGLAFASRRVTRAIAGALILLSAAMMPLALGNTGLLGIALPRVGILPGLSAITIVGCIGFILATLDPVPVRPLRAISTLAVGLSLLNLVVAPDLLPPWLKLTTVPDLTPYTAVFLILAAAGLQVAPGLYRNNFRGYRKPVLWMGVLGILVTMTSWYLARESHQRELQHQAQLIASQTADSVHAFYQNELATVGRLAERLEAHDARMPAAVWRQEVGSYFRDFPHLEMLAVLDGEQQPKRLDARQASFQSWARSQLASTTFQEWLDHDHPRPSPHASQVFAGPAGQPLVFLSAPVITGPDRQWTLLALSTVDDALQWLAQRQTGSMVVEITSGETTLFQSAPLTREDRVIRARQAIDLDHDTWTLTVSEPLDGGAIAGYLTETLVLFGGLALTFLIMVSRLLASIASHHNLRLRQTNEQLQAHLSREQELKQTNQRIVNFSNDLLCTIDRDSYFRFVSPASKRILGYAPEEMVGRSAREFVVEEDWGASTRAAGQLRNREPHEAPQFRNRYRHRDGHVVTLDWKARAPSPDGTLFCIGRDMTAELKAEELARQREAFFSLTPEMFCIVTNNHFLEVNQAFLTMLGYARADLVGRPYLEIIHGEFHGTVIDAVEELIRGETVYELEIQVLHHDGSLRWLRLNAAMHDERIYCSARDITHEKRVQKSLREKEHLLGMAEHIGRLGGWMVDLQTGHLVWSSAVCEIHDLRPGETPKLEDALAFYTPEYRQQVEDAVRLASELGLPFDYEARIRTATGRLRWVRAIGQAVRNEHGKIATLEGAFQDITASKEASEQIRRLAERQSRIFESITDAFFTLDREWRFTFMNQKCEELLQQPRSAVLGDSLWEVFPEAIGTAFEEHYHNAMATGETASFEAYFEPLQLWTEVNAYPSEEGLAVYFRSINERKKAEQDLEATMAELERSNQELQDFAFVASHDLQEPLRKIQTFSDRLLRSPEHFDEREQDYLQRMQGAARRMQTLIMDLLSYSRVSTRAQPFCTCDLNRIAREVLQDLEHAIASADAQVNISELPTLQGDPSQLRQVFQNLLSNAIKFHRPGVRPEVLVYADDITARGWTLVVSDNGAGFDPRFADRLFQPFQRLHNKNEYAGTGIGLAIVRKIVERHQGTIAAEGQPGEGATFRIRFSSLAKRTADTTESQPS